jgi:hypothetical protein
LGLHLKKLAVFAYGGFIAGPPVFSGLASVTTIADSYTIFGAVCAIAVGFFYFLQLPRS